MSERETFASVKVLTKSDTKSMTTTDSASTEQVVLCNTSFLYKRSEFHVIYCTSIKVEQRYFFRVSLQTELWSLMR